MYNIKTYNCFLNESENKVNNIIIDVIKKLPFDWSPDSSQIYRGSNSGGFSDVRSVINDRKIKGFLPFLEHLPSWSKFSNRKRAIIGTTNINYAKKWGDLKILIPLKDEVFVAPGHDLNKPSSFPFIQREFRQYIKTEHGLSDENTYSFIILIKDIPDMLLHFYENITQKTESYAFIDNSFLTISSVIDNNIDKLITEDFKDFHNYYETFWDFFLSGFKEMGVIKFLDYLFDPMKNVFKKIKYTELIRNVESGINHNNEVWFEDVVLVLTENDYLSLKDSNAS